MDYVDILVMLYLLDRTVEIVQSLFEILTSSSCKLEEKGMGHIVLEIAPVHTVSVLEMVIVAKIEEAVLSSSP